jgi:hypothetical protein
MFSTDVRGPELGTRTPNETAATGMPPELVDWVSYEWIEYPRFEIMKQ